MSVRVDEALIALAYCAKQTHLEELRTLANDEAITMINDQGDFLLFVNYCTKISIVLRGQGHLNFGHGMCRMIEKWYEKWSPVDLANMFGEHRGVHGWTHKSAIRKAHMRTKKRTAAEPAAAVAAAATNSATAQIANGSVATTSNQNTSSNAQIVSANDDDREQVFRFIFCNGGQEYLNYLESNSELGPSAQRLKNLIILKTSENVDNAIASIRQHKFTIGQMPAHLLEKREIWDALLPTLSVRQLLLHFPTIKDLGFLNENTPFARKFIDLLGNPNHGEKICPISLYILKRLYGKNVRSLGTVKAEHYEKKMQKRKITPFQLIKECLDGMFNQALSKSNPAPAKFMVVI